MGLIEIGIACFYLTHVLLLTKEPFTGFFVSKTSFVYDDEEKSSRPVNFFDYVRYYVWNPYSVNDTKELWMIPVNKFTFWSCPTCLSFWVASVFTLPKLIIMLLDPTQAMYIDYFDFVILHIASAGLSVILHQFLDKNGEEHGVRLQENSKKLSA